MSGPNLSEYFSNNPPSLFDEILKTDDTPSLPGISSMLSKTAPHHNTVDASNYFGSSKSMVPDEVIDFWEPPYTEPGIPPMLTMPGVQLSNDLSDPIHEAVFNLLGDGEAKQRKILTVDNVTQDERGLRQLIENGCIRAAVNLTGRLLTIYGQGYGRAGQPAKHSPHSLQLWFIRCALLVKLGLYDVCQSEFEPFGMLNRPDVYYDFYPEMYDKRKGSMAPFSFRLLLADLPAHLGLPKLALDRLTHLATVCAGIKKYYAPQNKEAFDFWQTRENLVLQYIINCSILIKDFTLADSLMEKLTGQPNLTSDKMRALYSAWGRIYLQCGDVFGAEKKFSESRRIRDSNSISEFRDLIDKGLIAVAQNDFQTAYGCFENALKLEPSNTMLLNNMGVCCLYSGKLKEAISYFEMAIKSNPDKGLNENLLLNLCTLYELESSNDVSKKLDLLRQINRHKSDLVINLELCLKLQTSNKIN